MGKAITAFGMFWLAVIFAGAIYAGSTPAVSTVLTSDLTDSATTINVASTTGFPNYGVVEIGLEKIRYTAKTATTFYGLGSQPLARGYLGSDPAAHSAVVSGKRTVVRTQTGAVINDSLDYNLAQISDSAGLMAFFTVPIAVFSILKNYVTAPLVFLGTDLAILSYIWGICGIGLFISLFVSATGGRRV